MFPRVGIPRQFGSYGDYVRSVEPLLRSNAIPDVGCLWWDARLQPRLGTVEVRIMDAQSRVTDVPALTSLVQCLVRRHADRGPAADAGAGVLAENRFLAARDGMSAQLIDGRTQAMRSIRQLLGELLGAALHSLMNSIARSSSPRCPHSRTIPETLVNVATPPLPVWRRCPPRSPANSRPLRARSQWPRPTGVVGSSRWGDAIERWWTYGASGPGRRQRPVGRTRRTQ